MSYDLNDVINATVAVNSAITENNDLSSINAGQVTDADIMQRAGVWLRDGQWDSCEMGLTQAEAQARFDAANNPEEREKILEDLRQRAIRRADLYVDETGKVCVFSIESWHNLGVSANGAQTSKMARQYAGMTGTYELEPVVVHMGFEDNGTPILAEVPNQFAVVLVSENGDRKVLPVGCKGNGFTPFQFEDAFDFLDDIVGEFGAKYHSAGMIKGGASSFITLEFPKQLKIAGSESFARIACIDSVDGKSMRVFATNENVCCSNTARLALNKAKGGGMSIRHTKNALSRIDDARRALGIAAEKFDRYEQLGNKMAKQAVEPLPFFEGCLDDVLEATASDLPATKANLDKNPAELAKLLDKIADDDTDSAIKWREREAKKRESIIADLVGCYQDERNQQGADGTVWNALQAVTDYSSHKLTYKDTANREQTVFDSPLDGRAATWNDAATNRAEVLIGA